MTTTTTSYRVKRENVNQWTPQYMKREQARWNDYQENGQRVHFQTKEDAQAFLDQKKREEAPGVIIDAEELEAFRAKLPAYRQHESYRLLTAGWDIVRALYLITKYPRDPQLIDVARFASAYGFSFFSEEEPQTDLPSDSGFFYVNTSTVMSDQIDLERAVLIALIANQDRGRPSPALIDGLHRLFKAARLGRKTLSAYILTPEEEQICRIM